MERCNDINTPCSIDRSCNLITRELIEKLFKVIKGTILVHDKRIQERDLIYDQNLVF